MVDRESLRTAFGWAAGVAIAFWSWVCTVWIGLGACGGDGGSPYAAPASPRGHFCSIIDRGSFVLWVPLVLLAASLVVPNPTARRWMIIAAALIPLVALVLSSSLSGTCAAGAGGDCSHY